MNRNKLKTYAPDARRDFIEAVTARAAQYGLTAKKIEPMTVEGDVAMIAGKPYSKAVGEKRKKLEARINRDGFEQTMEAMAYTWFNRLVAIRFMELHEYLDHGYRVLSHPQGHSLPEIVEHAEHIDLPGLDKKNVIELKLDGTKEEELYRLLLIGQCNALSKAMPFLFESIDDETELLLPDHLLHSDSLIRNLTGEIPEEDWQEVEIIGWLYQFYISEKKDEVIGKVVKSEDIPAATQLFTPNWIVKYLVQNSLGRQWMATYPDSPLKGQMEFYIEPAKQTPEVQAKLAEFTPDSLNPEEMTLLDPACGSGHILVEAYDLLKAIYQERGYRAKDIPRLILEKNLYGLEIDDRAAQLAAFALMMKARADDRSIFERGVQSHVLSIQESKGLDADEIAAALNAPLSDGSTGDISQADVSHLMELFDDAKTLGSLITVPRSIACLLPNLVHRTELAVAKGGLLEKASAANILPLIEQAQLLCRQYAAVVTNPPYLHTKNMTPVLKAFAEAQFEDTSTDTFEMFVAYWLSHESPPQALGIVSPFTWMFLSSFDTLRHTILNGSHVQSLIQLEYNAFEPACVPVCTFLLSQPALPNYRGDFIRLSDFPTPEQQPIKTKEAIGNANCGWRFTATAQEFQKIPGSVFAYWLTHDEARLFEGFEPLSQRAAPRQGLITGDNNRFLRLWYEVSLANAAILPYSQSEDDRLGKKWFPYQKGGPYRKWYGNHHFLVDWCDDGNAIRNFVDGRGKLKSRPQNVSYYFRTGATWSSLTSGSFAFRFVPDGFIFDAKGPMCFPNSSSDLYSLIALGNVKVTDRLLTALAPTLDYSQGPVGSIPWIVGSSQTEIDGLVHSAIAIAKEDWDSRETSWDFSGSPLLVDGIKSDTLEQSTIALVEKCDEKHEELYSVEQQLNQVVCTSCGVSDGVDLTIKQDDIALFGANPHDTVRQLLSYAIGCMMGRYSLDEPGLIYAQGGNDSFDASKYKTFAADEDGIVPVTEFAWFGDDAASRFERFLATAWTNETLEENLRFVAKQLGAKKNESARDCIRRYIATEFFTHHLQSYKGPKHPPRPIYWLFSSGRQRGFQALVYLHRYNQGTLSRMRTEYVIPLLGKMTARIDQLTDDIIAATSSQHRKRLEKEKDTVVKQLAEAQQFDEKLRHYADQRINLDLDDGVRINYSKFGDLLADVKTVTGTKP